jgi:hypothetical protein
MDKVQLRLYGQPQPPLQTMGSKSKVQCGLVRLAEKISSMGGVTNETGGARRWIDVTPSRIDRKYYIEDLVRLSEKERKTFFLFFKRAKKRKKKRKKKRECNKVKCLVLQVGYMRCSAGNGRQQRQGCEETQKASTDARFNKSEKKSCVQNESMEY